MFDETSLSAIHPETTGGMGRNAVELVGSNHRDRHSGCAHLTSDYLFKLFPPSVQVEFDGVDVEGSNLKFFGAMCFGMLH